VITKAKKTYNENDFRVQTQGVECKKDESVLDEIPGAYKNIGLKVHFFLAF